MMTLISNLQSYFLPKDERIITGVVSPDEFSRIEGKLPNFIWIEMALIKIGGGGWNGLDFKQKVMKVSGLNNQPYFINPTETARAFNQIREILAVTSNKRLILKSVQENHPSRLSLA